MEKKVNLDEKKLENSNKSNNNNEQENNNNKLSDERLNKKNKKLDIDNFKNSKNEAKKQKKKYSLKKKKSIEMYLVLFIFLSITTICLVIHNYALKSKSAEIIDKNKKLALAAFIILLIGSFVVSTIISCCECLIKTHFLGIIFFIALNAAIDYCVIYISYLNYFEPLFCFLIILVSGSFGCLLITIIAKDDIPNMIILLLINLFFCLISGLILFFVYKKIWDRLFSIFGLLISEFNVYSSQYKLCSKDKKAPITYSQPFELIISFFKMLFFLINSIVKIVKCLSKTCKCKKKEEKDEDVGKENENIPTDDIEVNVDNIEHNNNIEQKVNEKGKNAINMKKK